MSTRLRNGYTHECPYPGQKLSKQKTSPHVHYNKTKTRRMLPGGGQIQFLVSTLNSFHSQDQKLRDWCWVIKSTRQTFPHFSPWGDSPQRNGTSKFLVIHPVWSKCRVETRTDQRYISTRYSSLKERGHDLTNSRQFRHASNHWGEHDVPRLPTIQWLETHEGPSSPENEEHEEYSENMGWLPIKGQEIDQKRDRKIESKGATLLN